MQRQLFGEVGLSESGLDPSDSQACTLFRDSVRSWWDAAQRPMPWRDVPTPYNVMVSEVMLQQTQVARVVPRFTEFVARFPDFGALAASPLAEVLAQWSGLGYNRRARWLQQAARRVHEEREGVLPSDPVWLRTLPGIGANTAGSIAAFAYNTPVVFIETNIRRVMLHFFFSGSDAVHDREILPVIEATLDRDDPRTWYWALMDLGVELARLYPNANRRSSHYTRQSRFEGSDRQIRGAILRALTERGVLLAEQVPTYANAPVERVNLVIEGLERDRLVARRADGSIAIAD